MNTWGVLRLAEKIRIRELPGDGRREKRAKYIILDKHKEPLRPAFAQVVQGRRLGGIQDLRAATRDALARAGIQRGQRRANTGNKGRNAWQFSAEALRAFREEKERGAEGIRNYRKFFDRWKDEGTDDTVVWNENHVGWVLKDALKPRKEAGCTGIPNEACKESPRGWRQGVAKFCTENEE